MKETMPVRLLRPYGLAVKGQILTPSRVIANMLIERGVAEATEPDKCGKPRPRKPRK